MKKPLLLSLVAATLIGTNLEAKNMYDRILGMEAQMNALQKEIAILQEANAKAAEDGKEDAEETEEVKVVDERVIPIEDVLAIEDDEGDDEESFEDERSIAELEESISELNRATGGNHLKFNVDYRYAIDNMTYTMADDSTASNRDFMTSRLWLNMGYKATNNLTFKGQLAYNKAFGVRSGASSAPYESIDWVTNENAYDDLLRVRTAYFLWQEQSFLGLDIPWTFSIGRRPSTGGNLINLRDNDHATSPTGHLINVEFDGLSSRFTLNSDIGTSVKFCLGRGMSNAKTKFDPTPYADDSTTNPDMDIAGLIFIPYDDRKFRLSTMYYYANNLIDMTNGANPALGFDTVGGLHAANIYLISNGIGNEISDFLDESIFFASASMTKTDPYDAFKNVAGKGMLGSGDSETGYSYWIGTQFPSLLSEDGRWGLEYNQGSKYWRPITYGEDTNIGSKVAARGEAYEAYFTEYLEEDILSIQVRYTYIDYKYSGSNGFFGGQTGTPMNMDEAVAAGYGSAVVDKAQDIRFYIRYKY